MKNIALVFKIALGTTFVIAAVTGGELGLLFYALLSYLCYSTLFANAECSFIDDNDS